LNANEFKTLSLSAYKAYRVTSTGNIMIQSGAPGGWRTHRSFYLPSPGGGFVGKIFLSACVASWDPREENGFMISTLSDTKVTVWDMEFKRVLHKIEIATEGSAVVRPKASMIFLESDKPVSIAFYHSGSPKSSMGTASYGTGVDYFSVRPNEETPFFLPTNSTVQAYIFADDEAQVRIDDIPVTIAAGTFFLLTAPGAHEILSDKPLIVQVIHWPLIPAEQGVDSFGVVVPCVQTVNLTPTVKLTPLAGEGFPVMYALVGGVAAAAAAAGLLVMKRRAK
jgi:hypothetical protein